MRFRLASLSMTLDDLEHCYSSNFLGMEFRVIWDFLEETTAK